MSETKIRDQKELYRVIRALELKSLHQRSFSVDVNEQYSGVKEDTVSLMKWAPTRYSFAEPSSDEDNSSTIALDIGTTLIIADSDAVNDDDDDNSTLIPEKVIATLDSTFRLVFFSKEKITLSESEISILGRSRVLFDIWPYWREFVGQSCFRSNLPVIDFPPFGPDIVKYNLS